MSPQKNFFLLSTVSLSIIILVACGSTTDKGTAPFFPSPNSTVSPSMMASTLAADPNYLNECKVINPTIRQGQVGYLNIYPGKTKTEDIEAMIGAPLEKDNELPQEKEWHYEQFNIYIKRGQDVVDSILVYGDERFMIGLEKLIAEYGCPDLIYAIDASEDYPSGAYGLTKFIYYQIGIEIFFDGFPISLSETPIYVDFFKPQSLEEYSAISIYPSFEVGKPVTWDEAILERR